MILNGGRLGMCFYVKSLMQKPSIHNCWTKCSVLGKETSFPFLKPCSLFWILYDLFSLLSNQRTVFDRMDTQCQVVAGSAAAAEAPGRTAASACDPMGFWCCRCWSPRNPGWSRSGKGRSAARSVALLERSETGGQRFSWIASKLATRHGLFGKEFSKRSAIEHQCDFSLEIVFGRLQTQTAHCSIK